MQWRAGPVVLVVLIVTSAFAGSGIAAGPGPDPGAEPGSATGPTPSAADRAPSDPETDVIGWENGYWYNQSLDINQTDGLNTSELNAIVARTMARVEVIRQLEFEQTVPVKVVSRDEFRQRQQNRTVSPSLRTFDNAKFEALFLVPETTDSIEVQQRNRGGIILGQYNFRTDEMLVVSGGETTLTINELTLAHELMHALQDQHFNLSRYRPRTRDGANAQNGLSEGDARVVEHRYRQRCDGGAWEGTCLQPTGLQGGGGDLAHVGTYLLKYMPYSEGAEFVSALYRQGGWSAVNDAYANPPASSEQVIHPDRYRDDPPSNVTLEDRQTEDWRRVRPPGRPDYASVGESAVFMMLWYPGFDSRRGTEVVPYQSFLNLTGDGEISSFQPYIYDHRYSKGWDGDRMHVYRNDANETAYVWRLVWDSSADAEEFLEGYRGVLRYWGGEEIRPGVWVIDEGGYADAFHVAVEGNTVTIVNAPTIDDLPAMRQGVSLTPTPTPSVSPPPTDHTVTVESETPTLRDPATTTPGQPGFGIVASLAGLAVAALLGWRRWR